MTDPREIVLTVEDPDKAFEAISRDPREFGVWMRYVIGCTGDTFDSARYTLRREYGVTVASTKTVFINPNT